jgi:hypothetical protein
MATKFFWLREQFCFQCESMLSILTGKILLPKDNNTPKHFSLIKSIAIILVKLQLINLKSKNLEEMIFFLGTKEGRGPGRDEIFITNKTYITNGIIELVHLGQT